MKDVLIMFVYEKGNVGFSIGREARLTDLSNLCSNHIWAPLRTIDCSILIEDNSLLI